MSNLQLMLFLLLIVSINSRQNYHVIYQWNVIEPEWPNQETGEKSLNNGSYIPSNNIITGIKLWKDQIYLAVPRLKFGVPVTLTTTSSIPEQTLVKTNHGLQNLNLVNPKLKPFPNWEMQKIGDCNAFQSIQNMEIDPMGRLWLIDNGRINIFTDKPNNDCPPKIIILDIESNGKLLRKHIFPKNINYDSLFFGDMVIDHEHGGFAYITDNGNDPGLIVYSLTTNTSWKIRHETMKTENKKLFINKLEVNLNNGSINGIALSPASRYDRMVYYSQSFNIYTIPTAVLKSGLTNVNDFVKTFNRQQSQIDGMIMTSNGTLIFGLLANNSVASLNTYPRNLRQFIIESEMFNNVEKILAKDDNVFQWTDNFAIDEDGYLWCVTNNWHNYVGNKIDLNTTNFRVVKFLIKMKNYQYFDDGTAPILPVSHVEISRSLYGIPVSISLSHDGTFPIVGNF